MKKVVFSLLAVVFSLSVVNAQSEEDVPKKVKDAFTAKYPKASDVEWEKSSQNQWQAEFEMNAKEIEVVFDKDGRWMGTQTEMDQAKLPAAIKKAIAEKYKGYTVEEVEMVEVINTAKMYKVEMENGDMETEAMFFEDGSLAMRATDEDVDEMEMEDVEDMD